MKSKKQKKKVLPIALAIACTSGNITTFAQMNNITKANQSPIVFDSRETKESTKENFIKNSSFEEGKESWIFEGGKSSVASNNPHTGSKQGYAYYNSCVKQIIKIPYNGKYDISAWIKAVGGDAKFVVSNKSTGEEIASNILDDSSDYVLSKFDPIYFSKGDEIEVALWGAKSWADFDDIEFTYNNKTQENLLSDCTFLDGTGWNAVGVDFKDGIATLQDDASTLSQSIKAPNLGKYFIELEIKPLSDDVKITVGGKSITLNQSNDYQTIKLDDIFLEKNQDVQFTIEGKSQVKNTTFKYDIDKMNFTKPQVENIAIRGSYTIDSTVKVVYDFKDLDGHAEADTKVNWLVSDTIDGDYKVIDGENSAIFNIPKEYEGKYIKCEVVPMDEFGIQGNATYSEAIGPIRVNYIQNPSFENDGLGWIYNGANIRYDGAYDGNVRARIAKGSFNFITQEITVPETGYYDLSALVNSEANGAKMGIMTLASEPTESQIVNSANIPKSLEYTNVKINKMLLEKDEKIKIFFAGADESPVSIDQVELLKTGEIDTKDLNNILSFDLKEDEGNTLINKNNKTIKVTVPYGTDVKKLTVEDIKVSDGAKSSVKKGDRINLSKPTKVEIKSKNGKIQTWTVTCEVERKEAKVTSSNKFLEDNFNWSIDKTEQFVMTDKTGLVNRDERNNDGTGINKYMPSYWAGYYDRTAFYSRDFVHQATGGQIAGLKDENFNMFKTFAENSTESRKWYTLWAINFDGTPHTIDYKNDNNFVRELPAQFELVEKAYEQYLWTGDERYIYDEDLWNFYTKVMTDFIDLHDDQNPNGIPEGKGGIFQGSCTYNERGEHPIEAGDAIGSQYQATLSYAGMLEARGQDKEAKEWYEKADKLKKYFNEEWSVIDPNNKNDHYARIIDKDKNKKNDFGKENSWFMPMKLITEPGERNDKYLDYIAQNLGEGIGTTPEAPWNIEAYTYIPETYFPYNRNEEAWKWMKYIMNIKDEAHERPTQGTNGDYPEISFTFISHTVEGLMGIEPDAGNHFVATASHLPKEVDWINLDNVEMGEHELSVKHNGLEMTTLTNKSSKNLTWEARFYGDYDYISVGGKKVKAEQKEINGEKVSYVKIDVKKNKEVVAKAIK